jgi:hypothetical protein
MSLRFRTKGCLFRHCEDKARGNLNKFSVCLAVLIRGYDRDGEGDQPPERQSAIGMRPPTLGEVATRMPNSTSEYGTRSKACARLSGASGATLSARQAR